MPDHRLSLEHSTGAYQVTRETRDAQPKYCTCAEDEESDDFEFPPPKDTEEHVWRPRIKRFVKQFLLHEEEDVEPPPVPEKDYKYLRRCRRCGLAMQDTPESSSPTAQSPTSSVSPMSPPPQIPDKPLPRIPTPPGWPWAGMDSPAEIPLHLDGPMGPPSFPEPHPFNEDHTVYLTMNSPGDGCSVCPLGQLGFPQDAPSPPQSPSRSDRLSVCDSPTAMVASPSMHQTLAERSLPPSPIAASPTSATSPAGIEFSSAAEEKRALTVRNADEAAAPPEPSSSACAGPLPPPTSPPPAYTPWPMGHQETCAETSHHVDEDDQDAELQWGSPLHRRLSGMPSFGSALNEDHAPASTASVDPPGSPADVIEGLLRDVDAVAEEYSSQHH